MTLTNSESSVDLGRSDQLSLRRQRHLYDVIRKLVLLLGWRVFSFLPEGGRERNSSMVVVRTDSHKLPRGKPRPLHCSTIEIRNEKSYCYAAALTAPKDALFSRFDPTK